MKKVLSEQHKDSEYGGILSYVRIGEQASKVKSGQLKVQLKVQDAKMTQAKEKAEKSTRSAARHAEREEAYADPLFTKLTKMQNALLAKGRIASPLTHDQLRALAVNAPQTAEEFYAIEVRLDRCGLFLLL